MIEVRNLNKKLVGKLSDDASSYTIISRECVTIITANPDRSLHITHKKPKKTA